MAFGFGELGQRLTNGKVEAAAIQKGIRDLYNRPMMANRFELHIIIFEWHYAPLFYIVVHLLLESFPCALRT